jgi:hypothetical protein
VKGRGTQTKARLADYAADPLPQQTGHQFGFVMLTPAQQEAVDVDTSQDRFQTARFSPGGDRGHGAWAPPETKGRPVHPPGSTTGGRGFRGGVSPISGKTPVWT